MQNPMLQGWFYFSTSKSISDYLVTVQVFSETISEVIRSLSTQMIPEITALKACTHSL